MARYSYHFRSTAGAWGEANPHTYVLTSDVYPATRNGMTFGKIGTISSSSAYTAPNHSRLSGSIAATSGGAAWRIDLLDGPGKYRMYLAVGRLVGSSTTGLKILKNSDGSQLINPVVNGSIAAGQVKDATGAGMSAAAWLQSNVSATGTAQAGGVDTITLAAGASAVDDYCVGRTVLLTSGTGSGQYKEILAYNGTTKVATVRGNWTTPPDATSAYSICDGGGAYVEFTTTETAIKFQADNTRMDLAAIELEYVVTPLVDAVISEEHGAGTLSTIYAKEPAGKKIGRISSTVGAQNFSVPTNYLKTITGPALPPGWSVTGDANRTYFDSAGVLQDAAANVARITYDPVTLALRGVLNEPTAANVLARSEDLGSATWVKNNTTVSSDAVVSPDGATTADNLIATAISAEHICDQTFSATAGVTYVMSAHVRPAGLTNIALRFTVAALWPGSISPEVNFNLTTQVMTVVAGTPAAYRITALAGGWFRVEMAVLCVANGSPGARLQLFSGGGNVFTGNGVDGISCWGMQVETGSIATSYIRTTSAAVTRAAETLTIAGLGSYGVVEGGSVPVTLTYFGGAQSTPTPTVSGGAVTIAGSGTTPLLSAAFTGQASAQHLAVATIDGAPWLVATGTPMPDNFASLCASITIRQTTTAETRDTVITTPTVVAAPTKPLTGRLALLTTRTWLRRERIRAVTRGQNMPGYQNETIHPSRDFAAASPSEFRTAYQAITPDGVSWYRIRLQGSTMWTGIQDVSGYKDFGTGGLLVEPDAGHDPIIAAQWDNLVGRGIHWRNSILVPLGNYCFNGTLAFTASSYARILIEGNRIGHMFVPGEVQSNHANWNTFALYRFYEEITIRNNTIWGLNFVGLLSGGRITAIRDNDFIMWPIADLLRASRGVPLQVPRGVFADDETWIDTSGNRLINNPDTFANKAASAINHGDKVQIGRPGDGYLYSYSAYPNGNTSSSWTISPQTRCLNKVEKKIYKVVARAANGGYAAGVAVGGQGNPGPSGGAAAGDIVDGGVTWRYETDYYHEGAINLLMEDEFGNDDGLTYSTDTDITNVIAPSHQLLIASSAGMLCPIEAVVINDIYANGAGRGIDAGYDGTAHVELSSFVGPAERPVTQGVAVTLSNPYIDAGTVRAFNNVIGHSTQVAIPGGANLQGGGDTNPGKGGIAHQGNVVVDFTNTTANGRRPTDLLTGPFTQRSDGSYGFTLVEDGTNPIDVVISDLAKIMHPLSGDAGGRATEYHTVTVQDSAGGSISRALTITP